MVYSPRTPHIVCAQDDNRRADTIPGMDTALMGVRK